MDTQDWTSAPVGLLTLTADGVVLEVNEALLHWTGHCRASVVGTRLPELFSIGGRMYWETHLAPLLHAEGRVDEVAVELVVAAGRLPVLLTAVLSPHGGTEARMHVALSGARERSRYERELLAARSQADHTARQITALHQATAAVSAATLVSEVAEALLSTAAYALGARAATVWLTGDDGELHPHHSDQPPLPAPPGSDAEAVLISLLGRDRVQGVLRFVPASRTELLDHDVLTSIGRQAGVALDRAHLYERSTSVAHELAHSLLAGSAPKDDRFVVAAAYRPAVADLAVGGDWHDTFLLGADAVALVVGDVVGRGLSAAIAMGQLRSATRAVAAPGRGPAVVLAELDRFVEQVEAAAVATVAYGELDLEAGQLTYACAGHLPPLLLPVSAPPRFLWEGRSTPLGSTASHGRVEASVDLAPGDRVLLYTDGLVERRCSDIDDRMGRLLTVARRERDQPLADAVRTITDEMLHGVTAPDDACALLLAWQGPHPASRAGAG